VTQTTPPVIDADELIKRHGEYIRAARGVFNAHRHDLDVAMEMLRPAREEYAAWWSVRGVVLVFKSDRKPRESS
jgi:hypothetical protein